MKNNFEEYGFTADFEGEILKVFDNTDVGQEVYLGYFISQTSQIVSATWDKEGYCYQGKGVEHHGLTPIKKEWYEKEENFPCLCVNTEGSKQFHLVIYRLNDELYIHNKSCVSFNYKVNLDEVRPATKEELLSLLVEV